MDPFLEEPLVGIGNRRLRRLLRLEVSFDLEVVVRRELRDLHPCRKSADMLNLCRQVAGLILMRDYIEIKLKPPGGERE